MPLAASSSTLGERVARPEWLGLVTLLDEIQALDPRPHVHAPAHAAEHAVVQPLVVRVSPLGTLLQLVEGASEVSDPAVAAICMVARAEVRSALREVESSSRDAASRLVAADILRTRMIHAIDAVLAAADGRPADFYERADGRAAARVRALYGQLRDTLNAANRRAARDSTQALASVAVALHAMTLHPDWAEVRLSDRYVLEGLYRRILQWGRPDAPEEDGGRLLLDAVALGALLESINARPTLRRHDHETAELALATLARDEADPQLLESLALLRGRDPDVDAFLVRLQAGPSNPPLRRVLTQRLTALRDELAPPPANTLDFGDL